ncbi:TetR/AcrR family transcriptional regulator [Herbiconiux sp. KACC 21604]|uniref:TetR/AcrR family transcriptional regulator n=1 Tax=unclassified Herbiconiux TaxID=2618217 RepID=UPI001492D56A|nr:TetR/AcrR family transcriptional regulator [Herbiconiux sp. SALV-R1]QJU53280.1 TetR family transcriptional regulator [Herbiconiux sp. SALV-R1]WPO88239.1 TetR/AcrR family transcriptional regulator [Herbiconiux sp. KACC 21604]
MPPAGRPRASSKPMLEEAASELFLEQGYAKTTIEQITRRAGVSRNTFFNYFASKSDLLWIELDASLAALAGALAEAPAGEGADPLTALEGALHRTAEGITATRAPLVLTQGQAMGIDDELRAAGLARALAHADAVELFLAGRGLDPLVARAAALAVVGASAAAIGRWAADGPDRGPLVTYLDRVVHPVLEGFRIG